MEKNVACSSRCGARTIDIHNRMFWVMCTLAVSPAENMPGFVMRFASRRCCAISSLLFRYDDLHPPVLLSSLRIVRAVGLSVGRDRLARAKTLRGKRDIT